jgi:hypothetical protein
VTFERPLALALAAAVPLAWWLSRNRSGAPVVRVASLLAFRHAAAATPSAAPRRAIDLRLAMVLAAMTLLALAAAGPAFGAAARAAFYVVFDRSVSTTARTCDAATRTDTLLRDIAPDAERVVRELRNADGTDGLPESLAPHLAAARDGGFPGVVLVTDSAIEATPGIAIVGPSAGAAANASVASAVLDGDDAVVAVRNHGAKDVTVRLVCADVAHDVAVPAGGVGTARFAAPDRGEMATFEIVSPPDDLTADDRLVVRRTGGARRVHLTGANPRACPHLEAALRAAGAEIAHDGESDADVTYGRGIVAPAHRPRLVVLAPPFAMSTGDTPGAIRESPAPGSETVTGAQVVGRGPFVDVLPAPATLLAPTSRLVGGDAAWSVPDGAIVSSTTDLIVLAVDPEDPRSDWHRDPSFPAFVAAALDRLTDGPDRLVAVVAVPPSESDVVHAPPATSSPEALRAVMRPAGAREDDVRPARWLALGAAVLLGAAAFVRRV